MDRIFTLEFWRTFWLHAVETATARGLLILGILIGYYLVRAAAYRAIDGALARSLSHNRTGEGDRANRLRTLQGLARSIAAYVLFFILVIMLLDALGANVTGVITTAGVGGIAIGFGAQKLVKDIISGFFLIVEDQFAVGDYVTIGAATGTVEELGMRISRIRDDQGKLWMMANGDITTVVNHSRSPLEAAMEIGIAHGADVEKAQASIRRACEELFSQPDTGLLAPPRVAGVAGWDAARTAIKVVVSAQPRDLSAAQLEVREAAYRQLTQDQVPLA